MFQANSPSTLASLPSRFPTSHLLPASSVRKPKPPPPTQEQAEAVEELRLECNNKVTAWLEFARAIQPDFRFRPNGWGFSRQRVEAVAILCDTPNAVVLAWLEAARSAAAQRGPVTRSIGAHQGCRAQGPTLHHQTPPADDRSNVRTAMTMVWDSHLPRKMKLEGARRTVLQNLCEPVPPAIDPTVPTYSYWCTQCHRPYMNSDNCKKHEKEHENDYVCRFKDDDGVCMNADQTPTSFKRRYDLVTHLKRHGIFHRGEDIAKSWKLRSTKKAFACGFCIQYFVTQKDYLRHIHSKHFKGQHKTLDDWDQNTVVLSLLNQPEVKIYWDKLKSDQFAPIVSKWRRDTAHELQQQLEERPDGDNSAQSLAQAAYDALAWEYDTLGNLDAEATTSHHDQRYPYPTSLNETSIPIATAAAIGPLRPSTMTPQASHRSGSPQLPSISDPWNYVPDARSNSYLSPTQGLAGLPFAGGDDAHNTIPPTPYDDGQSTLRTPRTGSTGAQYPLQAGYRLPNDENPTPLGSQRQTTGVVEDPVGYLTNGAFGASPVMPTDPFHDPPSPSKSPSVTQRIKRACRKKSKAGIAAAAAMSPMVFDSDLDT